MTSDWYYKTASCPECKGDVEVESGYEGSAKIICTKCSWNQFTDYDSKTHKPDVEIVKRK